MDVGLRISVLLRKAKIDDADGRLVRIKSNQDIVRLQVIVNNVMCVDLLKARNLFYLS